MEKILCKKVKRTRPLTDGELCCNEKSKITRKNAGILDFQSQLPKSGLQS